MGKTNDKNSGKRIERKKTVSDLVGKVEEKLLKDVGKATLGDYVKLLQLLKELDGEETRELKVTWVDAKPETESEI